MRFAKGLLCATVAGAIGLVAPATQAHFLQTDPIGYKDDNDLYVYVGDDPLDRTDPTGLSCVKSDSGYACKVDDPGKMTQKEVKTIERAYTTAVNQLMSHPDVTKEIKVDGVSFKVTAGEVGEGLIKAKMIGSADTPKGYDAQTIGGKLSGIRLPFARREITIFRNALSNPVGLRAIIGHEGIHTTYGEDVMNRLPAPIFDRDHGPIYNRAAQQLEDGH